LRFVTPTLQAAAIADLTPSKSTSQRLAAMSDKELLEVIVRSPKATQLVKQGVKSKQELWLCMAEPSAPALPIPITRDDEELLR
jgi:TusA-related sulfurtransferase